MIKPVAKSMPIYLKSCFLLPNNVADEINRLVASFWWGNTMSKQHIHWRNWNHLCQPKVVGGLDFRNITEFNKALLAKQWWRTMQNEILRAKYFLLWPPNRAMGSQKDSYLWRSLLAGKRLVDERSIYMADWGWRKSTYTAGSVVA